MLEPLSSTLAGLANPVLTAACGTLAGIVLTQYNSSKNRQKEMLDKQAEIQFAYLDPLRIAAEDFAWKFFTVEQKIRKNESGGGGKVWMIRMFHFAKEPTELFGRDPSQTVHGK